MAGELKKWLPIAGGVVAGVVGLLIYQKHAAAAVSPGPAMPASVTLPLQPGATSVGLAPGGALTLTLPTGATWASTSPVTPLNPTAVQPTGSEGFVVTFGQQQGNFPLTANWLDSSGNAKQTILNISVSTTA